MDSGVSIIMNMKTKKQNNRSKITSGFVKRKCRFIFLSCLVSFTIILLSLFYNMFLVTRFKYYSRQLDNQQH